MATASFSECGLSYTALSEKTPRLVCALATKRLRKPDSVCQLAVQVDNALCRLSAIQHSLMSLIRWRNANDDVCITIKKLCRWVSIKIGIVYVELCREHCSEIVNDQMELRIIDKGNLYYGSQNKTDYDRLIERLKRGV